MKNKTLLGYYAFQWKASSRIQLIIKKKLDLRGASRPPGIIRKKKAFSHRPRKPLNPGPGPTLGDVTREMGRLL